MELFLSFVQRLAPKDFSRAPKTSAATLLIDEEYYPYKPLLLLVVFQRVLDRHPQFAQGRVRYEHINRPFQNLLAYFYEDWDKPIDDDTAVQPFWKLCFGRPKHIWNLLSVPGKENEMLEIASRPSGQQVKTRSKLNQLVQYAYFSEEDWAVISNPFACEALINFLIYGYFSSLAGFDALRERVRRIG